MPSKTRKPARSHSRPVLFFSVIYGVEGLVPSRIRTNFRRSVGCGENTASSPGRDLVLVTCSSPLKCASSSRARMWNSLVFSELTRSRVRFLCGLAGFCAVPEPWTTRSQSLRALSRQRAGCAAVVCERYWDVVPDIAVGTAFIVGSERRPHLFVSIHEAQEVAIERAILWVGLWLTAHPRVDRSSGNLSTGPVSVLDGGRSLRPALRPRPLSQRRPSARPQTASSPSSALILLRIIPQVAHADRIHSRRQHPGAPKCCCQ